MAKKYRVKKDILFGSVVKGKRRMSSDIDLAVCGLMPHDYFKALMEGCRWLFKKRIEEEILTLIAEIKGELRDIFIPPFWKG